MKYLHLDPDYPELWLLGEIARLLANDAVGVIPTDSYYAFVCDMANRKAIERLYRLKDMDPKKPLSILVRDLSMAAIYTRSLSGAGFRSLKRCLPGPYTFVLKATAEVPRIMLRKRRTLGIRIPDDEICSALLEECERPLLCTSVRTADDSYWNEPARIAETYGQRLDFVVDGGPRLAEPSSVVDLSGREPVVIREGKGDVDLFI